MHITKLNCTATSAPLVALVSLFSAFPAGELLSSTVVADGGLVEDVAPPAVVVPRGLTGKVFLLVGLLPGGSPKGIAVVDVACTNPGALAFLPNPATTARPARSVALPSVVGPVVADTFVPEVLTSGGAWTGGAGRAQPGGKNGKPGALHVCCKLPRLDGPDCRWDGSCCAAERWRRDSGADLCSLIILSSPVSIQTVPATGKTMGILSPNDSSTRLASIIYPKQL